MKKHIAIQNTIVMLATVGMMLAITPNVFAQTDSAQESTQLASEQTMMRQSVATQSTTAASRFSIGAMAQAHSVSNISSPWFGVSADYQLFNDLTVGVRGFLPMSQPVDKSTYSIQAFSRIYCKTVGQNRFFVAPDYAMNFYDFVPFQSAGAALGVLSRVNREMSVGVSGGIEVAKTIVDSIGLEHVSNLVVYPKVGLISNFYF